MRLESTVGLSNKCPECNVFFTEHTEEREKEGEMNFPFSCDDCFLFKPICGRCMRKTHKHLPLHRIKVGNAMFLVHGPSDLSRLYRSLTVIFGDEVVFEI